jgi:cobalt-zinc-cadmium efflux system protein
MQHHDGKSAFNSSRSFEMIRRIRLVVVLTGAFLVVQVVFGYLTGSLALIADAGHMLADTGGLAMALLAAIYARKPVTSRHTYGYYRSEILASLGNSLALILVALYIFYESYTRLIHQGTQVDGQVMLIVASIGLILNLISMQILRKGHLALSDSIKTLYYHLISFNSSSRESAPKGPSPQSSAHNREINGGGLNLEGASLEVLSDILSSVGVIIGALIIIYSGFYLIDPILSAFLAVFILPRTWALLKKSIHILMEGAPPGISFDQVKQAILEVKGVTGVFDLHIWTISSEMNALSAHVGVLDLGKSRQILLEINSVLEKKFQISHTTIQIETYHV